MAGSPQSELVDASQLERMLRAAGVLGNARVLSVTLQPIGAEFGFLDSIVRAIPRYDRAVPQAPGSVVVKVSSCDPRYQRIGSFYNAYEREFRFYEQIAPRSPVRLPKCFAREVDAATDSHVLVLEDLGSLTAGDQVVGLTVDQARAALTALGRFHAAWWNSEILETLEWMPPRNLQPARYVAAWRRCRAIVAARLGDGAAALGDRLPREIEGLLTFVETGPRTIVHSDFRADNLMFDEASAAEPVVILDWQLAVRGRGIFDVARLLCGSISVADRQATETTLVKSWHDALVSGGVANYSFDDAWQDYRRCVLLCLYYPVTIHEAEEAAGLRGAALADAQMERMFAAAADHYGAGRR